MKNNGFTIIETMLYIALFSIIMSGTIIAAYQLLEGGKRNQNAITIQEEGAFLSRKINWALIGATDVSVDPTNKILKVTRPDLVSFSQSPLTFTSTNDFMMLARGANASVPLHGDAFKITGVSFVKIGGVGLPTFLETRFFVNKKPFTFKTYIRQL